MPWQEVGEMAQGLRELAALAEDSSSIPSIYMVAHKLVKTPQFHGIRHSYAHMWYIDIGAAQTLRHIKNNYFFKLKNKHQDRNFESYLI